MTKERDDKRCAKYALVWYDADWNEIGRTTELITAHWMIAELDLWNRKCQRVANDEPFMITSYPFPTTYGIEVHFVER